MNRLFRYSFLIRYLALLVAVLGQGCATVPDFERRPESAAFSDPESTYLGRRLAPAAAEHPGQSGFRLLDVAQPDIQARIALAALAERSIDAQYFIWNDDTVGKLLAAALVTAADRGVRVRILVDDFYIGGRDTRIAAFDRHPNIEIRVFNPNAPRRMQLARLFSFLANFRRLNHRMHNKLFLVDGSFGVAGGRNVGDEYFGLGRKFNLRDRDVLTVGPVVAELGRSFDAYWNGAWAVPFEVVAQDIPTEEAEAVLSSARSWLPQATLPYPIQSSRPDLEQALERTIAGLVWARVEVHYDRPDAHPDDADGSGFERVQKALTRLVAEAKRELLIQTPYFVPRDVGIKTIVEAARAGVAIRIMTNSLASTDEVSAQAIYATLRSEMLANGVRMFELKPDAGIRPLYSPPDHDVDAVLGLHAKSIVADREVLYIGTFNVDARSAALNTEIALIIYSPELAGQVADTIERDMRPENSWEVVLDESGATSWIERRGDEVVRHSAPPRTSVGRRMRAGLLSILPIDSQL